MKISGHSGLYCSNKAIIGIYKYCSKKYTLKAVTNKLNEPENTTKFKIIFCFDSHKSNLSKANNDAVNNEIYVRVIKYKN